MTNTAIGVACFVHIGNFDAESAGIEITGEMKRGIDERGKRRERTHSIHADMYRRVKRS